MWYKKNLINEKINEQQLELERGVGSVHAHIYDFPFQQPSTSRGTHTTFFTYRLVDLSNYSIG